MQETWTGLCAGLLAQKPHPVANLEGAAVRYGLDRARALTPEDHRVLRSGLGDGVVVHVVAHMFPIRWVQTHGGHANHLGRATR